MTEDRRAFLKKLAEGTIYSIPVIRTLSTPPELAALTVQQPSMKDMGNDMGGGGMFVAPAGGAGPTGTSTAPWAGPPGG